MRLEDLLNQALTMAQNLRLVQTDLGKKLEETEALASALNAREVSLAERESLVADLEKAGDVWGEIKKAQDAVYAERVTMDKARGEWENKLAAIRKDLAAAEAQISAIEEQKAQVRAERAALEQEKVSYRETVKQEFLNSLK